MKVLILILAIFTLTGCTEEEKVMVDTIDTLEAKEIINNDNYIIIDVRTEEEYNEEHIKDSINIPLDIIDTIEDRVAKSVEVIVYCRSGNRSKQAADRLIELGYTKVYDLGGIDEITLDKVRGVDDNE